MNNKSKIDIKDIPTTTVQEPGSRPVALDEVKEMISSAKSEVLEEAREEIYKQVQTDKVSLITVFGVFASVISLLTIEFQFLRSFDNPFQIVGFSLVLVALLLSFNVALDYLVKSRLDRETPRPHWWVLSLIGLFFGVGIIFLVQTCQI